MLLLIHWLFVLSLCFFIGPCFAMHYLVAFHFCDHLAKEEITGCFTFIVFLLLSVFGALCLCLTVSYVGMQCAIVAFLVHTYLLFEVHYTCLFFLFLISFTFVSLSLLFHTSHALFITTSYLQVMKRFVRIR